jgi:hypothetical protein
MRTVLLIMARGTVFDSGSGGGGHFNWDMVERSAKQGF